ncbi:MAG: class I SAM-dependent methyltransferase [Actinobacteria bacterium]|nr:class I SAM-dependent methyltransferase [Actinomycetota bacterium]MBU1942660.1 class I SAM-dependent methyltransferase [Actinomycetota bacterium]MBU2685982.1 class I SAM-dependent methyltransferase [Actinomycetota bacterium]
MAPDIAPELQLTGERTLPGIPQENYWFQRHLVAYEYAMRFARGARVIDVGCGEGYGPAMLARDAESVLGIDVAPEVVRHALSRYHAENLSFEVMDVNALSAADGGFDLAVSFQVVEHLVDVSGYFAEMARVLAKKGVAVLTTPNRLTISPGRDEPINPFHLREYTPGEFRSVLEPHFAEIEIIGLFHTGWLSVNERLKVVDFIKVYEMGRLNPRRWTHRLLTPLLSTREFRFGSEGLERCLDMVAVCRRPGGGAL